MMLIPEIMDITNTRSSIGKETSFLTQVINITKDICGKVLIKWIKVLAKMNLAIISQVYKELQVIKWLRMAKEIFQRTRWAL